MPRFRNPAPVTFGVPRRPRPIVPREQRETLEEHEAAQAAIEFATLRRQADDIFNTALRTASEAPDEDSATAIFDQATQAASKLQPRSKNIRVQNAFSAHIEGSLAGWNERFAQQRQAIRTKQTLQQGELDIQAEIEKGDLEAAAVVLEHMKIVDPGNRPKYDQMEADLPVLGVFAPATRQIRSDDPQQIQEGIQALRDMDIKGLRGELVEERNKLLGLGEAQLDHYQSEAYQAFYANIFSMALAEDQSPVAHARRMGEATQSLIEAEKSGAVNPHQANTLRRALVAEDGRFVNRMAKPDEGIQAEFYDRLLTVRTDSDAAELRKWMADNAAAFGESYDVRVKELHEHKVRIHDDAIQAAVTLAVIDRGLDAGGRAELSQWALAKTKADPAIEPAKLTGLIAEQAVVQQAAREARKGPPVALAFVLGVLQQKVRRIGAHGIPERIMSREKAIDFIVADSRIWFDERLRPEDRARIREMLDAQFPGPEQLPEIPGEEPEARREAVKAAPAPDAREIGKVYTNAKGQKAEWTGEGWKLIP